MGRLARSIPALPASVDGCGRMRLVSGFVGRVVALSLLVMAALVILVGTQGLRFVSDADAQVTSESRLFGTIDNMLRGNDVEGAVSVVQGPKGDSLVVRRGVGQDAYEIRLFLHDGHIMQETVLAGASTNPDKAVPVAQSSRLSISAEEGGIRVTADEGQAFFATRCPMEGTARQQEGGAS